MKSETWQSAARLIKNYPRVFKLIWETNPLFFILSVCLTLCSAVVLPVQIWITKLTIDGIAETVQEANKTLPVDWYAVLTPVGVLALIWAFGIVCQSL